MKSSDGSSLSVESSRSPALNNLVAALPCPIDVEMVAKALHAQPLLPNTCPKPLSQSRTKHASNKSPVAPASALRRLQQRHCHAVRTSLNATESSQQHQQDQPQSAEQLERELQDAIVLENYKEAAELRDAIKSLQPRDSATSLKKKMDQLVSQDKFEVSLLLECLC